uniref:uncharacterized protein LOC122587402 isoform X2 n=1 Tax=Erigeron canadensis TaxID=72917 RepID=UPI001CB9AE62|nr:uncharacterized protein LOC122587402 isoform X2 [Erigeron canadensis]
MPYNRSHDEEDDGDHLSNLILEEQLDPVSTISDDNAIVVGGDEVINIDDEDYVVVISDDEDGDGDGERESDEQVADALPDVFDCVLQGSKALQELSLYECESYLRKHGIRVSGTKEECIQRIEEHKRLKDGHGESLYPISSFYINCTGDACRGDVVLFKQHIKKGLNIVGKRTVTGRILEESYGELDQQHTFSVEVLWSKPYKKLNPLSILLVKGRHLYGLKTLRQPWKNEAERLEVLAEKHCRGDAARLKRKLRQTEFGCNNYKGAKRQKLSHIVSSQCKEPIQMDKQKSAKKGAAATSKESTSAHERKGAKCQEISHIVLSQCKQSIQIDKQKSAKKGAATTSKESSLAHERKDAKRQKVSHIVSSQCKEPIQIDKQKSAKKGAAATPKESTSAHERKAVPERLQKLKFKKAAQLTFPFDAEPNLKRKRKRKQSLNPNLNVQSDYHLQEVSSSFPNDKSYHDHNDEQRILRFRSLYARSSFSINCMGDACIGDVVLFNKNKIKRKKTTGTKAIVAGRIVGENYGASEKQDTFMIEVLWTEGYLKLSPLSTLQVKAWDLYRPETFRQPWKDEQKRSEVLRRKHSLVEAARHNCTLRKKCIASIDNKAVKCQKVSHKGLSQSKQSTQTDKQKYAKKLGAAIVKKSTTHKRKAVGSQKTELERAAQLTFYSDPTPISNPNQNPTPNPILKPNSTPNPRPKRNSNPKTTLKLKPKPKPNAKSNFTLSPNSNRNTSPNPTSNPHSSPNLNHHMSSDCHLQEASPPATFFYHSDRTSLPSQPAPGFSFNQPHSMFLHDQLQHGFSYNQPPCGFSYNLPPYGFSYNLPPYGFLLHNQPPLGFLLHNQPPFGLPFQFPGYVQQWVQNDVCHEPPGHYSL